MCFCDSVGSRSRGGSSSSILLALAFAAATSAVTAVVVRRKFSNDCRCRSKFPNCPLEQSDAQQQEEAGQVHDHCDDVSELSAPFVHEEYLVPLKGFNLPPLPEDKAQTSVSAVDVLPGMFNFHEEKHNVTLNSDETEQTLCSVFTTETLEV